jgi:hypothetical protein
MSQALHAWLPSFGPSGTKATFGEVGAHRLSRRSYLLALVPWHFVSVLTRKEFVSCSSEAGAINPVVLKYFLLVSSNSVLVRETDNFEMGAESGLQ